MQTQTAIAMKSGILPRGEAIQKIEFLTKSIGNLEKRMEVLNKIIQITEIALKRFEPGNSYDIYEWELRDKYTKYVCDRDEITSRIDVLSANLKHWNSVFSMGEPQFEKESAECNQN